MLIIRGVTLLPRCPLQCAIILIVLTACSPSVPLRPTTATEIDVTTSIPGPTNTPLAATKSAASESAAPQPSLQSAATDAFVPFQTTRLAIVDQSSIVDSDRAGWWSIQTLGPIGQVFRPSFAGLDAVELWTEDQWDAECSGMGASLQVNIREAAIDGVIVGSSLPVVLPDCFKGITLFSFPSFITVTPDILYVIEVTATLEDNWGVVWQQVPDSYPHGEAIVLGESGDADIWFQEGLRNSTPLTEAYCQNSLWQHVQRADGSGFRDQNDCIRFVNTGR
jgi:hypothetical protein